MERKLFAVLIAIFVILGASMPLAPSLDSQKSKDAETKELQAMEVPRAPSTALQATSPVSAAPAKPLLIHDMRSKAPSDSERLSQRLEGWANASSETIESSGVAYKVVSEVRAIPSSEFRPADGNVIERRGNFILFEPNRDAPLGAKFVVYNEKTKSLGVITGAYQVALKDFSSNNGIASQYHLKAVQGFEELKVAFYQNERVELAEITSVLEQLKNDPRVERADLHILDRTARSR